MEHGILEEVKVGLIVSVLTVSDGVLAIEVLVDDIDVDVVIGLTVVVLPKVQFPLEVQFEQSSTSLSK